MTESDTEQPNLTVIEGGGEPSPLDHLEWPEQAAAIEHWIDDATKPAPTPLQLTEHMRRLVAERELHDPVHYVSSIAVERSELLKAELAKAEAIAKDVTRSAAYDAINKIVEQRNLAEGQCRYLIRDLFQIAATLLCTPSQSGVITAIESLKESVRTMDARIAELTKELEDAHGEVDSLNDQLTDANATIAELDDWRAEDA
jgi:chromosome segregation ATPase